MSSYSVALTSLALFMTSLATASDSACYISTSTVPHPTLSCTPFDGICPMIACAETARPKATVTVPKNYAELMITGCLGSNVPTVTSFGGKCTTDCGPITCPTLTVTESTGEKKECCFITY